MEEPYIRRERANSVISLVIFWVLLFFMREFGGALFEGLDGL